MTGNCLYYVEGNCEKQLLSALKEQPELVLPGKIKVRNVISDLIPKSELLSIKSNTTVVLVFDTDIKTTDHLKKNISNLKRYCNSIHILTVASVPQLEDELVRSTDVREIKDLTGSRSISDFKRDFCKLKNCRQTLIKHKFDIDKIWVQPLEGEFDFINQDGMKIKPR